MRILFVSGNREKLPDGVVPLGVLYVMAATPDHHEKHLLDLCFEMYPEQALRDAVGRLEPDLVALGMRNIQNNDYSGIDDNLAYYRGLIDVVREVSPVPVVLGGSGFSVMPRELMERLAPDFGISGEAEGVFGEFVETLERGEGLEHIAGLHRRVDGAAVPPPRPAPFVDMNTLRVPDRSLVDVRYYERYATESVQTKRGCPLRCDYCTYPLIEGRVGRTREPAAVVDEMFAALETQPGIEHFFIVDSVFNLPKTHAKNVCRELIARGWQVPWTCYANPLGFDREFTELARQAGCAGMEVGSDSGCDHVLERLRKGFKTSDIRNLHELCADVGIPDCHTFILGTQGETLDDVHRTLDFVVDLDPFAVIMMIWVDDTEALDPALRVERRKLRARIEELLLERKDDYPQWIIPPLGINFGKNLFRTLRRHGRHGPLWQFMRQPARVTGMGAPTSSA
ncbi:MAG: B12-binding domain-containing radical SAM protein [Myxococcota bacterium]